VITFLFFGVLYFYFEEYFTAGNIFERSHNQRIQRMETDRVEAEQHPQTCVEIEQGDQKRTGHTQPWSLRTSPPTKTTCDSSQNQRKAS
jgi:hypothetical protein